MKNKIFEWLILTFCLITAIKTKRKSQFFIFCPEHPNVLIPKPSNFHSFYVEVAGIGTNQENARKRQQLHYGTWPNAKKCLSFHTYYKIRNNKEKINMII